MMTDDVVVKSQVSKCQRKRRTQMGQLFRKVYSVSFLRVFCIAVAECFAMFDDSIRAFFSGSGGLVIIGMVQLVHLIVSGYATNSSKSFRPDDGPSNKRKFIALSLMEGVVYAGTTAHLYQSHLIRGADVLIASGSLGAFQLGHVLFFFNPWLDYRAVYGLLCALLCVTGPAAALLLAFTSTTSGWMLDDDGWPVGLTVRAALCLASSLWHSFETHAVVWDRHRSFRFQEDEDEDVSFFLLLSFSYADPWNVLVKCLRCCRSTPEEKEGGDNPGGPYLKDPSARALRDA